MKRVHSTSYVIFVLASILVVMVSCVTSQVEQQTTLFDQYYSIDPKTLVNSLKSDETNAFVPLSKQPEFLPLNQQVAVNWIQADYFSIISIFYSDVLEESLQGWSLTSMDFRSTCQNIDEGFQNARFTFFTVAKEKENESRISRFIDIDTRGNFVHVKEEKYSPQLVDWSTIDMEKLKISAEQAFQIAETNGGSDKRQSVDNVCEMSVGLAPDYAGYRGWEVIYTKSDDGASLFRIQVDPYTGEFHFP